MSIYKTAYDTSAGSGFVSDKIKHTIRVAMISGLPHQAFGVQDQEEVGALAITGMDPSEANIPVFAHPILVETKEREGRDYLCSDFRAVLAMRPRTGDPLVVKNTAEYDFNRVRLTLNLIWLTAQPSVLRDISTVPCAIYAHWVSEALGRRFALDPKEQLELSVLAAAFYANLFRDSAILDDEGRLKLEAAGIKATKAPYRTVQDIVGQINEFSTLKDFCTTAKALLNNPRLDDLNSGLIITMLGGSWFGSNAREILGVALEHPPTWIALCYTAFKDRSYRNSVIAKITERYSRNKGGDDFVRALVSLLEGYTEEQASN